MECRQHLPQPHRGEPEPERQPRRVSAPPRRPDLSWRLPKIPSKTAKFHLQIVENRLEFQSKIVPLVDFSRRPCVAAAAGAVAAWHRRMSRTVKAADPYGHLVTVRFLTEILDDFRRLLDEIWRF